MSVKVLGPLDTGTSTALSPRERAVLVALIVRAPSEMTAPEIADACWGDRPPSTWAQQVRTAVNRIRSHVSPDIIRTTSTGYQFGLDLERVDAVRFERQVSAARGHTLRGESQRAVDTFRRALALWRGPAYPDLPDWDPARAEASRLDVIRESAEEELLAARLASGEARAVIPDAERLVREQPLREERWALLALANYGADRQAESLAAVRTARRILDEQLGIAPSARLAALETAILRQDPGLSPTPEARIASADCPYRGLQPFGPEDAEIFAGREADIDRVLERLRPAAIVTITGPSGTGKSSLLLAGVVPRLREGGRHVEIVRGGSAADALHDAIDRAGSNGVVALDQAEELFTMLDARAVAELCHAAATHVAAGGEVLITVRSDFLDRAVALPEIGAAVARDMVVLGPLGQDAIRAAVEEPAQRAGLSVEPALVEVVLHDAGTRAGVLPLLSHALVETWRRREGGTLTVAGYLAAGGIAGAIAQSAERMYADLTDGQPAIAQSLLLRMLERDADSITIRRAVPVGPLVAGQSRREVLQRLVEARLVTLDDDTVVIAHEAVGTAWPRLDRWLTEDADDARQLGRIATAAASWEASGRSEDDLFRGGRLQTALEWRDGTQRDLTSTEQAFLAASEDQEHSHHRDVLARAQRDRVQNRRLRTTLGVAAALLVVAVASGGTAMVRGAEAATASLEARIEALASTSVALRSSDQEAAALLAVEAYRRWPDDARVRSALLAVLTAAGTYAGRVEVPDADAASAALLPGTRHAVAVRVTRAAEGAGPVWRSDLAIVDIDTGEVVRTYPDPGLVVTGSEPLRGITVSSNGQVALVQTRLPRPTGHCCMTELDFVDLQTGRLMPGSQLLDSRVSTRFLLTPDGGTAYLVNPVTSAVISVDALLGTVRQSVEVTPILLEGLPEDNNGIVLLDDRTIVTSDDDKLVVLDAGSLNVRQRTPVPAGFVGLALAADGSGGVVAVGRRGLVRVDLRSSAVLWRQPAVRAFGYAAVEVDPVGGMVYAADSQGTIDQFKLATGSPTDLHLIAGRYARGQPVVIRSGKELVLIGGGMGGFVHGSDTGFLHWRLDGSSLISKLVVPGSVAVDGFDLTGERVVLSPDQGSVVWDVGTQKPLGHLSDSRWLDDVAQNATWGGGLRMLKLDLTGWRPADDPAFGAYANGEFFDARSPGHVLLVRAGQIESMDLTTGLTTPVIHYPPDIAALAKASWVKPVASVSVDPDTRRMAVTWWAGEDMVSSTSIFDMESGAELVRGLEGVKQTVLTPDGELVGLAADRLVVASFETLEVERTMPRPGGLARGLALSEDGRTLLATTWNQRALLYDLPSGTRLGDPIISDVASWAPAIMDRSGTALLVNTSTGVQLWDLDPAHHAQAACQLAGRDLTASEWGTYLADLGPQRPVCP